MDKNEPDTLLLPAARGRPFRRIHGTHRNPNVCNSDMAVSAAGRDRLAVSGGHDVVELCDTGRQRGDSGLIRDVDMLKADIHAAIRVGQIVRVTTGGYNPASVFADGQGDGPGDPAAPADYQHGLVFHGGHLFLYPGGAD